MKKMHALLAILLFACTNVVVAQNSRQYIKDAINGWGSCRNVAITLTGGDLALNETNAYSYSSIPDGLATEIKDLHAEGEYIDDVQLTEDASWLVLYGNNGLVWHNIPYALEKKLRQYNEANEVITSVTFNDEGEWIVITKENIASSSTAIDDLVRDGLEKYGVLWSAHLTDDGLVLCFERGYKFRGNVPDNVREKLKETDIDVYRIKFLSDGAYFIADKNGKYSYYM